MNYISILTAKGFLDYFKFELLIKNGIEEFTD